MAGAEFGKLFRMWVPSIAGACTILTLLGFWGFSMRMLAGPGRQDNTDIAIARHEKRMNATDSGLVAHEHADEQMNAEMRQELRDQYNSILDAVVPSKARAPRTRIVVRSRMTGLQSEIPPRK